MKALERRIACEFRRKVARLLVMPVVLVLPALFSFAPVHDAAHLTVTAYASAGQTDQPAGGHASPTPEGRGSEAPHDSAWSLVARLVNFGILAGTLIYVLRSPLGRYIAGRATGIRRDLVTAADMRRAAASQLEEIDRRLKALPAEIDNLKARGVEEIAAEEARIAQAADAERQRLLEQTRREIDLQLRAAKGELVKHAAELAIGVASDRIKRTITPGDHLRLVDRYVDQVKPSEP